VVKNKRMVAIRKSNSDDLGLVVRMEFLLLLISHFILDKSLLLTVMTLYFTYSPGINRMDFILSRSVLLGYFPGLVRIKTITHFP
jgi:hypothetical protein